VRSQEPAVRVYDAWHSHPYYSLRDGNERAALVPYGLISSRGLHVPRTVQTVHIATT